MAALMRTFDESYLRELMLRLNSIPAEARPQWGRMTPAQMIDHLNGSLHYALGTGENARFAGNWFTVYVVGPLLLAGILRFKRNVEFRDKTGRARPAVSKAGGIAALEETAGLWIERCHDDAFRPPPHPWFGRLSVKQWSRFHWLHCEHHLRQFGR